MTNPYEKSPTLPQRMSRLLWRRAAKKPLSERGMVATQEQIVRMMDLTPPLAKQKPQKARKTYLLLDKLFGCNEVQLADVADYAVDTDADDMVVRVYTPEAAQACDDSPCLVYFHGGGVVIGDLNTHDKFCRVVAEQSGFVVVSVDYRLSPEVQFPVPVEDAIRGWNWVCENAEGLGIDLNRTGVGGDSAGGYMAVSVCHQAKQVSLAVAPLRMPAFQWLIYPMLDCRLETESTKRCTERMALTRETMAYFFDHYLPASVDRADPVVSPALADDLSGLPKAYLSTAGFDPLEDEGRAYAEAFQRQGGDITTEHFPDVMHGFIGFTGICPTSAGYVSSMVQKLVKLA